MITYKLTKPQTLNQLISVSRQSKIVAAQLKASETERARLEILAQHSVPVPSVIKQVYIAFDISFATLKSDPDGLNSCAKPILDGLVKAKIITDDSLVQVAHTMFFSYFRAKREEQCVYLHIFFNPDAYFKHIEKKLSCLEK